MDVTQIDDLDLSDDPLDVVEHVLSSENLEFDRTEDGDLAFVVAGGWSDYDLWFGWRPDADCLQLCLSFDKRVRKARHSAVLELVSLINQRVWVGHFEVWDGGGEIVYRHALALSGAERPSRSQTASMIDAAVVTAERFYPAFEFVLQGKKPVEAMAACMFETVGVA